MKYDCAESQSKPFNRVYDLSLRSRKTEYISMKVVMQYSMMEGFMEEEKVSVNLLSISSSTKLAAHTALTGRILP